MKRLLLITGDIAAGKTTFSNQLAQRYSVAVFQKDTIKEILGDNIGFLDREENRKLSNAAVQLMAHLFWQIAADGKRPYPGSQFSRVGVGAAARACKQDAVPRPDTGAAG